MRKWSMNDCIDRSIYTVIPSNYAHNMVPNNVEELEFIQCEEQRP